MAATNTACASVSGWVRMTTVFTGTLHLSEKEPTSCLRAVANLESPHGMVRVVGDVVLEEAGDDNTLLRYEGDVELGGRLAAVSTRSAGNVS